MNSSRSDDTADPAMSQGICVADEPAAAILEHTAAHV
jgi:hypothetical protein